MMVAIVSGTPVDVRAVKSKLGSCSIVLRYKHKRILRTMTFMTGLRFRDRVYGFKVLGFKVGVYRI